MVITGNSNLGRVKSENISEKVSKNGVGGFMYKYRIVFRDGAYRWQRRLWYDFTVFLGFRWDEHPFAAYPTQKEARDALDDLLTRYDTMKEEDGE